MTSHFNKFVVLVGIYYSCISISFAGELRRTWTSLDGASVSARLIKVEGENAVIERNGVPYTLPIVSLSKGDQEYINRWSTRKSKSSADEKEEFELKISKKGKLLYKTSFKDNKEWRVSSGEWICKDNAITGTQAKGKGHKGHMVIKNPQPVDVIITCEMYLGEAGEMGFTIDDRPKKLGQVLLNSKVLKGLQTHRTPGHNIEKKFSNASGRFAKDEWHSICIEMRGDQVVAQVGDHVIRCKDSVWKGKPKRLGFLVNGGPAKYRNLTMWEARAAD